MRKVTGRHRAVMRSALLPGLMVLLGAEPLTAAAADLAEAVLVAEASGEEGDDAGLKVKLPTRYSQASGRSVPFNGTDRPEACE